MQVKSQHVKTVRIGDGSLTLTIDASLFDLRGDDREFVFGLVDAIAAYERERVPVSPVARKGGRSVDDEIIERAVDLVQSGVSVGSAALAVGVWGRATKQQR